MPKIQIFGLIIATRRTFLVVMFVLLGQNATFVVNNMYDNEKAT